MDFVKPHAFSKDEALARMRALTDYWQKHGVASSWNGDRGSISGKFKGFSFSGEIVVEERRICAKVEANLIARKVGGAYVQGKISDYLDPKTPLEALQARAS